MKIGGLPEEYDCKTSYITIVSSFKKVMGVHENFKSVKCDKNEKFPCPNEVTSDKEHAKGHEEEKSKKIMSFFNSSSTSEMAAAENVETRVQRAARRKCQDKIGQVSKSSRLPVQNNKITSWDRGGGGYQKMVCSAFDMEDVIDQKGIEETAGKVKIETKS